MTKPFKFIYAAALAAGMLIAVQPSTGFAAPPIAPPSLPARADLPAEIGKSTESATLPPRAKTRPPQAKAASPAQLAAASCTPADFGSRTGAALVSFVKASTVDCVNTLFSLTGSDAYYAFREAQMVTIATAMRDNSYPGNNSTSMEQLVLFLRAGYYVQFYHPGDVGSYGGALKTAIQAALDRFFANPRSQDVTDANGQVLSEAVILIDSAGENARYLYVVRRLLNAFNSQYNQLWYMRNAVNNTFTVLFRGHWVDGFNAAVAADPSTVDSVYNFAINNFSLLGTDSSFMIANAGGELARFLDNPPLVAKVRPLVKSLLDRSAMTGSTAPLWVRTADVASSLDNANCAYYGICNFRTRLEETVLPIRHVCSSAVTIRAQNISGPNLASTCTSLAGQVGYFHNLVRDNATPVANDYNTSLEVVAFHSSDDYQTYAGVLFGIDTNNGGMYLEGDPARPGNIPRFIAYEAEWLRPVLAIWNLNHEFTHYLDGRFNMYGDFTQSISVPDIWWIEGIAEYVSYGYRNVTYDAAITEAGKHTYALSTLWDTTYENSNTSRTYHWGYLAVRYMFERHAADIYAMLAKFRTGDYAGARAVYATSIGTRYNADFNAWLDTLAGGGSVPECTGSDVRALDRNCKRSNLSASAGNLAYLYIYLPAGVSTLSITSSGGTGNADLYYNANGWATPSSYSARSVSSGNTESITVSNPAAGYRYISLYATSSFSGVAVTTRY